MMTFILLFAGLIMAGAAWMIASGAGKRKRSRQAGTAEVHNEQEGGGAPKTGRATGTN